VRGLWFAVPCDADGAPEVSRLRTEAGGCADAYYYRALSWVMRYRQSGRIADDDWRALAEQIRWPDGEESLRDLFVRVGIVDKDGGVFSWQQYNGWILRKYAVDRKRQAQRRRAGRASAAARRRKGRLEDGR
jgi:hypothetical protein